MWPVLQAVVLEYRIDRTVATGDEPPLVLARMPADFVDRMGPRLKPGKLLRFVVEEPGIQVRRRRSFGSSLRSPSVAAKRPQSAFVAAAGCVASVMSAAVLCTSDVNASRQSHAPAQRHP